MCTTPTVIVLDAEVPIKLEGLYVEVDNSIECASGRLFEVALQFNRHVCVSIIFLGRPSAKGDILILSSPTGRQDSTIMV